MPLSGIKGKRGERTSLYERLFKKQGVYVIRDHQGDIVYIGIAGSGSKEGGLADRLWSHIAPTSALRRRLEKQGLTLDDCTVAVYEEDNSKKRRRAEMYGIAVCDPPANLD